MGGQVSILRKQLQDAEASLLAQAEAEARWREDQVRWSEAEVHLKAEVERLRLAAKQDAEASLAAQVERLRLEAEAGRLPSAAAITSSAAVPTYGGLASDLQEAEAVLVAEVERAPTGTGGSARGIPAAAANDSPSGLRAEAEAGLVADVELVRTGTSGSAQGVPAYGGEYLARIVKLLEQNKESSAADASRALSKQMENLVRLKAVMEARLSSDDTDAKLGGPKGEGGEIEGGEGWRGVLFDASVDDDEVLLRLFHAVDGDGNGTISMEELLAAPLLRKAENAEMARLLRRAVGCDLQDLAEALKEVGEDELQLHSGADTAFRAAQGSGGHGVKPPSKAAVKAVFDAIGPSGRAVVPPGEDQAAAGGAGEGGEGDTRVATRADLNHFLAAGGASSGLAIALGKLSEALPADGRELDFLAVKAAARKVPRVAAQRLEWVRTMKLDSALARHLPPGTLDDGCAVGGGGGGFRVIQWAAAAASLLSQQPSLP